MRRRRRPRLLWLVLGLLILLGAASALAAGNSVPQTGAGIDTDSINVDKLKPPECAGLDLDNIRTGSGTSGNDLLLGGTSGDFINGGGGDDCILGGGGFDIILGGGGFDICLRGPDSGLALGCEQVY